MRLPEYSWAQGLLVAVHYLVLAYENNTNCPSMKLEEAAEKLDTLRRVRKLDSAPAAWYYLSNCRSLHSMDVHGPTIVSGWRQFVTGEPYIRNKSIVLMGDPDATRIRPQAKSTIPLSQTSAPLQDIQTFTIQQKSGHTRIDSWSCLGTGLTGTYDMALLSRDRLAKVRSSERILLSSGLTLTMAYR